MIKIIKKLLKALIHSYCIIFRENQLALIEEKTNQNNKFGVFQNNFSHLNPLFLTSNWRSSFSAN